MHPHPHYLKHHASSSTCAWSPALYPGVPGQAVLACGTVAGAVDGTFSSHSTLELVSMDFSTRDDAPIVLDSVQAPERFNRVAWGPRLQTEPSYPQMGIIAGGLADGSVCLWDPAAILSGQGQPLLARMQKHTGAVKGLEFNAFSPNLLATGAADSDLCIWDLTKPTTPSLYPALKGAAPAAGAVAGSNEITCVSWNRKVQHILASSSTNGTTVVWDLKRQKPVISFRDPSSQRRASVLQWNPDVATQLVVASDDDRSPTLQMWDLRNSASPLKEFVGHSKGVLGMAWSPHDPSLLLSCAKDNRTICWDVHSTDLMCELPAHPGNWNFDVQWCPQIPGVFSSSSFDGQVGVHNLHACTSGKVAETVNPDFSVTQHVIGEAQPLRKAPQWMKRPCGVSFGFGGRLVSFANHKTPADHHHAGPGAMREHGTITISQVVTEHELVERSQQFEQAIAGGEKQTLQEFCAQKAQSILASGDADESEAWSFLALLFEVDGRRELLKRLGFEDVVVAQQAAATAAAQANGVDLAAVGMDAMGLNADGKAQSPDDFFGGAEDDPDFFDKLPEEGIMAAPPTHPLHPDPISPGVSGHHSLENGDLNHVSNSADNQSETSVELEEEIQRAMIAGNYESAVESCFKANRLADALLIANVFNRDLFKTAMYRYMKKCPKPYMHIVRANVDGDWETLVRTRPVGRWQETLALLATYTAQEHWTTLCDMLAARLIAAGMHHAASLCYVCSGNVDAAVAYWARAAGGSTKVDALQVVVEKAIIMGLATGNKRTSGALADLVTTYAYILATQGRMSVALDYLEHVPGEASPSVATLRDRIYRSGASMPPGTLAPPFPFVTEDVRPAPNMAATASYGAPAEASGYASYAQQAQQQQHYASAHQSGMAPTQASMYASQTQQPAPYAAPSAPVTSASPYAATPSVYGHSVQGMPQPQQPSYAGHAPAAAPPPVTHAYTPTTTCAATMMAQHQHQQQMQAAQQMQAQQAQQAQQAAAVAAYNAATSAPLQHVPPAAPTYTEPAAPVYQARRTTTPSMPPPHLAAAPVTNPYHAQAAQPAAGPPPAAAPQQQAADFNMPRPSSGASTPATSQPASYFMPTTTSMPQTRQTISASNPLQAMQQQMGSAGSIAAAPVATMPGTVPGPMGASAAAPVPPPSQPQPPPPPPGPPANISIATADTSRVPADQQPIVATLANLHASCTPLANNPAKKREMDDNSKKIGLLLWRLNASEVSEGVLPKLMQLCMAIDSADWHTANHIQVQMTTTDWDECGYWLSAVKRLMKMRMQGT